MEKLSNCVGGSVTSRLTNQLSAVLLAGMLGVCGQANAQIAKDAYRALGQQDLARNGLNRVQGVELNSPGGLAVDVRNGATHLYISDSGNHRILGWTDARSYQTGDAPGLVLGQVSPVGATPLGTGATGLVTPRGIAVDPLTGNVYVADTGNHRVLRFSSPFENPNRVEPDAVYGQPSMADRSPSGSGNNHNGLRSPLGVAVDASGNLWIADSGGNRVLRYPASALNGIFPSADLVIGQKDFTDVGPNRSGTEVSNAGFSNPSAVAFDAEGNLYVADTGNARILRFTPPVRTESAASTVLAMPTTSAAPMGILITGGQLFAAIPRENRVLVYALPFASSAPAPVSVLGQADLNGRESNAGVSPRSAAFSLSSPTAVATDASRNIFVADAGNHRVLRFTNGSRSAEQVWGQLDFVSNSVNQVKPSGLNVPVKIAVDYSREPFALYVSDTRNHRVLYWKDASRFRTGDPADGVIGQADLRSGFANFDGSARRPTANSLSSPTGIAVDGSGNLYIADTDNNRILRFYRPVDQFGILAATAVIGQPDFTSAAANATSATSLRTPTAVAIGPDGNIFVSDTGNNRVLEFPADAGANAAAIRVYGQPGFQSNTASRSVSSQTLLSPAGLTVDQGFNLFVADAGANRVVVYVNTRDAAPASNAAVIVIGSESFDRAGGASNDSGGARLRTPSDLVLDSAGRLFVADTGNNRILVFSSLVFLPVTDAPAMSVIGQADMSGSSANWDSRDGSASAQSLASPLGVFLDRQDTLYVADSGNHRVMHFLKTAAIYHSAFQQASTLGRGALAVIEGEGLSTEEAESPLPWSQSLAGREVVINDALPAALASVKPSVIQLQIPSTAPLGSSRIAVRTVATGELIAGTSIPIATYAPGIFAKILNQDGSTNGDSAPAAKGSTIRITGTGQGPVSPPLPDGEAAQEGVAKTVAVPTTDGAACLTRQPSVCVAVGNTFGEIQFSGLAAGTVGVWQLDVTLSPTTPSGKLPLRVVINAVPSNIVTVAVR